MPEPCKTKLKIPTIDCSLCAKRICEYIYQAPKTPTEVDSHNFEVAARKVVPPVETIGHPKVDRTHASGRSRYLFSKSSADVEKKVG